MNGGMFSCASELPVLLFVSYPVTIVTVGVCVSVPTPEKSISPEVGPGASINWKDGVGGTRETTPSAFGVPVRLW